MLRRFDPAVQAEVAVRIARLDEVPETALQELDAIVERQTKEATQLKTARLGGMKAAADMINLLGASGQTSMIDAIKAQDPELGEQIKDALFVFENLLKVDDRGIQSILREVQADVLSVALKAADEEIKEKIFKNMSKRAVEILKDDIAAKGPVRLDDVEAAQKEILAVALRLAEEGTITLAAAGKSSFDALANHRRGAGRDRGPLGLPVRRRDRRGRAARRAEGRRAPAHGGSARRSPEASSRRGAQARLRRGARGRQGRARVANRCGSPRSRTRSRSRSRTSSAPSRTRS